MKKIKRFIIFLGYLILVFIPLIIGFIRHIKGLREWLIIGVIQIIFIILALVIMGITSSSGALNNSDGY